MNQNSNSQGLIIGTLIVLVILIAVAYLYQSSTNDTVLGTNPALENNNSQTNSDNNGPTVTTNTTTTSTTTTSAPGGTAFTIKKSDLSSEQQTMLTTAGFDGEEIVITNEMKACVEQSLGTERTQQIVGGQKPTVIEAGKLIVCYNQ